MQTLPTHFRYIDWSTYGLLWLIKLAERHSAENCDDAPILSETCAYGVQRTHEAPISTLVNRYLCQGSVSVEQGLSILKQLSAGLRVAYLSGANVESIGVVPDSLGRYPVVMVFNLLGGGSLVLRQFSKKDLPKSGEVVLQGGDPAGWYNLPLWSKLRPLDDDRHDVHEYPLSTASHCDSQYTVALLGLGAKTAGNSSDWFPPPATSNQDLQHYLLNHPQLTVGMGR